MRRRRTAIWTCTTCTRASSFSAKRLEWRRPSPWLIPSAGDRCCCSVQPLPGSGCALRVSATPPKASDGLFSVSARSSWRSLRRSRACFGFSSPSCSPCGRSRQPSRSSRRRFSRRARSLIQSSRR